MTLDSGSGCISFSKIDEKALTQCHKQQGHETYNANNYRSFVNFTLWRFFL